MTYYRVKNAASTVLTDLLDLQYSAGKRALLDPLSASTGAARFRLTANNESQIDSMTPGEQIEIDYSLDGSTWTNFISCFVADIMWEYGNPTPGPTYNDDYATITFEGYLAYWGRANGAVNLSQEQLSGQLLDLQLAYDFLITDDITPLADPVFVAYSATSSPNEYLQLVAQTLNARVIDYQGDTELKSSYEFTPASYTFTDSTATSTAMTCQRIMFDAMGDNYYNQVLVSIGTAGWPAAATAAGAQKPYRTLQIQSQFTTANEALGFAQYMLDLFETPGDEIAQVTCLGEAQHTDRLPLIAKTCIGKKFTITFRTGTYYGICEGFDMVASPGTSTYNFYFSTADQDIAWFILNDADLGVLNENMLGF